MTLTLVHARQAMPFNLLPFKLGVKKFGSMEISEARQLKVVEEENGKLKKLLTESLLDNKALKAVLNRQY